MAPIGQASGEAAGDRGNKHEGHFRREGQGGPAYVLVRPIALNRAQGAGR